MKNFTIVPNELIKPSQLTPEEKLLVIILLMHCGQDDFCFPSQRTLGKEMGFTDRHIRNILKKIESYGLIFRQRLGYNRANTYRVAKQFIVTKDRNSGSYHLGSIFPLHQGSVVPPKSTYLKAKGKRSLKGLDKLEKQMVSLGLKKRLPIRVQTKIKLRK